MVAPYAGRLSRSMVRVPGSGTKDDATNMCLDLGKVSRFASIVPVPHIVRYNGGRHRITSSFSETYQKRLGGKPSPVTSSPNRYGNKTEDVSVEPQSFPGKAVHTTHWAARRDALGTLPPSTTFVGSQDIRGELKTAGTKRSLGQESPVDGEVNNVKRFKGIPSTSMQMDSHSFQSSGVSLPAGTHNSNVSLSAVPVVLQGITSNACHMTVPCQSTNGGSPAYVFRAVPKAPEGGESSLFHPSAVLMSTKKDLPGSPPEISSATTGSTFDFQHQQVVLERDQLRRENAKLKYHLYRFQRLLKSKQLLMCLLRHNESVPLQTSPLQVVPSQSIPSGVRY